MTKFITPDSPLFSVHAQPAAFLDEKLAKMFLELVTQCGVGANLTNDGEHWVVVGKDDASKLELSHMYLAVTFGYGVSKLF